MVTEKKRITVGEAAIELGVSERHIYNLVKIAELQATVISLSGRVIPGSIRISSESIQAFLQRRQVKPDDCEGLE
ncbi:MAG: helix-turn-helix domain-containing protein [Candidatus Neomarinimicrobiota bacterium]|jgi:hypothetical protein